MLDLSQSDKDMLSFCLSDDSDMEMDPRTSGEESAAPGADAAVSDGSDGGEESEPRNPRAAPHMHTAWQNDYFVVTDNRNYPDARLSVKDRWKSAAHFGRACGSKTMAPSH